MPLGKRGERVKGCFRLLQQGGYRGAPPRRYHHSPPGPNRLSFGREAETWPLKTPLRNKRGDILRIAAAYGARNVRVFGSLARGEADQQSNLDFLVEMEPGRSLLDLGGLQYELERLLGCRVDVVTERGLKRRIRDRVLREALPV